MPERFRLIKDSPLPGAFNMGSDRALLDSANNGSSGPVLRFYGWREKTLSLGYTQRIDNLNIPFLEAKNIQMVKRPTGGRALLHGDEVTYALVVPETSRYHGNLSLVYSFAEGAIIHALKSLKVPVDLKNQQRPAVRHTPYCFATSTRHEVSVKGVKVSGSAQRRQKKASLQHGSVMLSQDRRNYLDCFAWEEETKKEEVLKSLGGVNDFTERNIEAEELCDALINSFVELYDIEFFDDRLTGGELAAAKTFAQEAEIVTGPLSPSPVL